MEEMMNNVVETSEVVNPMDDVVDMVEQNSGGSKKLLGLAVAGVATVAAGAVVLFRKHKKKIKENEEILDEECDDYDNFYDEEIDQNYDEPVGSTEEVQKDDESSKE